MNPRRAFLVLGVLSSLALSLAFAFPSASAITAPATAVADTYEIDGGHSAVLYRVTHLGVSYHYGRFDDITGSITFDQAKPENSKISVEIKTASINTGNAKRDGHLKSPDFFDATQFPTTSFKSTGVKKKDDKHLTVTGDFSLHGVTKPVTIDIENVGVKSTQMGERAGFHGEFTIKRSDYGIKYMPDGLGEDVLITVSLEGVKGGGKGGEKR